MYISILVLDRFQWFHCQVKGLGKILRYTRGNIFWVLHLGLSQRKQIIFLTLERYIEKKKKGAKSWRLWQDQVHGVQNMSVLLVTFRDDKMTLGFTSLSVKLLAELQFVLLSYWQAAKWLLQLKMGWSCFSDWPVMDSCPFVISFIFWLLFIILIHHFFPVTLTERYTTKQW